MHWTRSGGPTDPAISTVQRLLRGDMTEAVLGAVLAELRTSADWVVLEPFDLPPERLVQMVYQPTKTPYGFRAVRVAPDLWRFVDGAPPG